MLLQRPLQYVSAFLDNATARTISLNQLQHWNRTFGTDRQHLGWFIFQHDLPQLHLQFSQYNSEPSTHRIRAATKRIQTVQCEGHKGFLAKLTEQLFVCMHNAKQSNAALRHAWLSAVLRA